MIRKRNRKAELCFILLSLGLGLACLTFYIWYQTELIRLGIEIRRAEETISRLKEEIKSLEAIRSSLLALDRVDKIAREKLNLKEPDRDQLVYEEMLLEIKK